MLFNLWLKKKGPLSTYVIATVEKCLNKCGIKKKKQMWYIYLQATALLKMLFLSYRYKVFLPIGIGYQRGRSPVSNTSLNPSNLTLLVFK